MTKKKSKKEDSKYFNKKFFTFFTIAAFFVFAIVLVVAPLGVDKASITGNAPGDTYINGDGNTVNIPSGDSFPVGDKDNGEVPRDGFFSNWFNGTLSVGFLKIFFFVLVTMLIFSILHMSGIPNNKVLQFLFAGVVGFVSTAYIVPAELYSLLTVYSALGMSLIAIVPFIILMLFSVQLFSPVKMAGRRNVIVSAGIGNYFLFYFLWTSYILFLLYQFFAVKSFESSAWIKVLLLVSLLVSVGILVLRKYLEEFVTKMGFNKLKTESEAAAIQMKAEANAAMEAARIGKTVLDSEYGKTRKKRV